MDATARWTHGLTFIGSANTGFELTMDAAQAVGGDNHGFRPMELFVIGLAGCTGMDVISILGKKQQDITSFEVKVHADKAQVHPKVFTHITIEYIITGRNLDPVSVERSVELSVTKYCPANAMLRQAVPIETKITILEAV